MFGKNFIWLSVSLFSYQVSLYGFVLIDHFFLIQKDCKKMFLCGFVCMCVHIANSVSCLNVWVGVMLAFIFPQPKDMSSFWEASYLEPTATPLFDFSFTWSSTTFYGVTVHPTIFYHQTTQPFSAFSNKKFIVSLSGYPASPVKSNTCGFVSNLQVQASSIISIWPSVHFRSPTSYTVAPKFYFDIVCTFLFLQVLMISERRKIITILFCYFKTFSIIQLLHL